MSGPSSNNYQRSPIPSAASYDSSSVSSAASPSTQGAYGGGLMGASPRPSSGQHLQHMSLPPSSTFHGPYQNSYHPGPTSPGAPGMDSIASNDSSGGTPGAPASQMTTNLQAQKRAYRQRRKDPSCDACRERKVKCDATETTSCSECSSRNVKCQFTKETNRRMSSIKQVQDLEKQVTQVKRENAHLRSLMNLREGQMDLDVENSQTVPLVLPEIGSHPKRRQRPPPPRDLSRVRMNLRNYGRGIFKPPPPYRQIGSQGDFNPPRPDLPPKHVSDHLLQCYYASVHTVIPILHWPTFKQEYEEVYQAGSLQRIPPVWCSLLFSVLAVGVLYRTEPGIPRPQKGKEFIEISRILIDLWNDEFTIDHARSALLTSIFLTEMNLKSAAWTWLASAVRIAQDIGLHSETGPWPTIEGEMRRRVWWGIYVWDRLISLELGRPLLIEDADCDVSLPAAIDDLYIHEGGMLVPNGAHPISNQLLPTIHVVRSISQLIKTLKSPTITAGTLATFDTHFRTCLAAFSPAFQLESRESLDPRMIAPMIYLMNARIILHRNNLSTSSAPDIRANAVEQSLRAAIDTTNLLSRIAQASAMGSFPSTSSSQTMVPFGPTASAMLATHIWRCTLLLLFAAHYDAALVCIQASALIGSYRPVNIGCGRYLTFFLGTLIDKRRKNPTSPLTSNVNDEELMAYVSGDLQASTENSWVWQGSETGMALNRELSSGSSGLPSHGKEGSMEISTPTTLTEAEMADWPGWDNVKYLVEVLMREGAGQSQFAVPQERDYGQPQGPSTYPGGRYGSQQHVPTTAPQQPPARSESQSRTADRISIANII